MPQVNNYVYLDLFLHGETIHENILTNPLELFFQEIELAIKIAPNEIWGIVDAINISRYVFNKYVTITQIKNEITTYINRNCQHSSDYNFDVSVETIEAGYKDLVYIVVKVLAQNEKNEIQEFLQKFLLGS